MTYPVTCDVPAVTRAVGARYCQGDDHVGRIERRVGRSPPTRPVVPAVWSLNCHEGVSCTTWTVTWLSSRSVPALRARPLPPHNDVPKTGDTVALGGKWNWLLGRALGAEAGDSVCSLDEVAASGGHGNTACVVAVVSFRGCHPTRPPIPNLSILMTSDGRENGVALGF